MSGKRRPVAGDQRRASWPIRVLSMPGRGHTIPYVDAFCDGLDEAGMEVVGVRSRAAKMFRFDILHLHFPEHYVTERSARSAVLNATALLICALITKLLGKTIVWTVHDVLPSRQRHRWLLWPYLWCMRALTDAYVFMSRTSESQFFAAFRRPKRVVISHVPHGSFEIPSMSRAQRDELRGDLTGGADCLLVGFIGEIKPYKNIGALAQLPPEDPTGRPIKFLIAGLPHHAYDAAIIEASLARIAPERIIRLAERPSDRRIAELNQIVDLVLLPYTVGWNSGGAVVALSCHARILCSGLPMFRELAERPGAPWVYVYDHEAENPAAELWASLSRFAQDKVDADAVGRLQAFLADTSFPEGTKRFRELYTRLMTSTSI
ncbi:MAG: hypothetical protein ACLQJR_23185 [Stellaceae bacterium]